MAIKGKKQDGRSTDLTFSWMLTTLGPEWQQWQEYAAEWMKEKHAGIPDKQKALTHLFESYLFQCAPYASDVALFFKGFQGHYCSSEEFEIIVRKTISAPDKIQKTINYACDFLDFVIERHCSEENDDGKLIPVFQNPLNKIKTQSQLTETVRNPLPYRYIQDLRQILCPMPDKDVLAEIQQKLPLGKTLLPAYHYCHFKDWEWAQEQTGEGRKSGDWFEVEPELIDTTDPDCVWRSKEITRNNKQITIHQIWSPVKAMVVFVKLHLPLRTYQVRMLDSGEADTWRYENGAWCINDKHDFVLGSEKRPFGKGVFRCEIAPDLTTQSHCT